MKKKEDPYVGPAATSWTVAFFSYLLTYNDPAWKVIGIVVSIIAFIIGILYFAASASFRHKRDSKGNNNDAP